MSISHHARVMYESVCKFGGEREWGKNGFHVWPRKNDREVVTISNKSITRLTFSITPSITYGPLMFLNMSQIK
jgi:hypothetical protein